MTLQRPADALAARLALIDGAEDTIDVQYYAWNSDTVGYLLLSRLLAAADRGVSVRMLIDDLKLRRRSRSVASLCLHPGLEVRIFNAWRARSNAAARGAEFVMNFRRLNRRMHNKLLITDGSNAIFGGRNIGDEHFGLASSLNLIDFDVMLAADTLSDFSAVFDAYWTSASATATSSDPGSVDQSDLRSTRSRIEHGLLKRADKVGAATSGLNKWDQRAHSLARSLDDDSVSVVSDNPEAPTGEQETHVGEALRATADGARRDLVVATPFLVPSKSDIDWYREIIARGVRVRVLTNSLATNPGTVSNSGLDPCRSAMLEAGVELHELRADAATKADWECAPNTGRFLGLHAKAYVIDRAKTFLGSVNLDPRSKLINTEMGVLIDDAALAGQCADAIIRLTDTDNAWRVEIGHEGRLQWRNDIQVTRRQPARNLRQRVADVVFRALPIQHQI